MRCGDCKHYGRETETLGRCRRYPPSVAVFFRKDANEVVPFAAWPQMHAAERGCGEYEEPADNAAIAAEAALRATCEKLEAKGICSKCGKRKTGQLATGEKCCACWFEERQK